MFSDNQQLIDKSNPRLDEDAIRKAEGNVAQLTAQLERDGRQDSEFEPLGAEFTATRDAFADLYQSLLETGRQPEPNGALHPPGHPKVDLMPNGDVFGSYDDLDAYLKPENLSMSREESKKSGVIGFEKHHLIEKSRLEPFGFSEGETPCVAIYQDEHMQLAHGKEGVTSQLPRIAKLENGEKISGVLYDIDTLVEGHTKVYQELGRPEWAERLRGYVRDNRKRIIQEYEKGTVPWATPQNVARVRKYLEAL